MSLIWQGWLHTAESIDSRSGDWSYTFEVDVCQNGLITGAVLGADPAQDLTDIRAGLYIRPAVPGLPGLQRFFVHVVMGDGEGGQQLFPPRLFIGETTFHIHRFEGQYYFASGSGTFTADDGLTSLDGTLFRKVAARETGMMSLLAGFAQVAEQIDGEVWDGLSSNAATGAPATAGQSTITLPFQLGTFAAAPGEVLSPTSGRGAITMALRASANGFGPTAPATGTPVTGNTTVDPITEHEVLVDTTGGDVTITLPSSPADGDRVTITNDGPNNVIILPGDVGDTVDGGASYTLPPDTTVVLEYDDATNDWVVVEVVVPPVTDEPPVTADTVLPDPPDNHEVLVDTTGGDVTITLPSNPTDGETVTITADGPNSVIVQPAPGQTIGGGTTPLILEDGDSVTLEYDAATNDWVIVDTNAPPVTGVSPITTDTNLNTVDPVPTETDVLVDSNFGPVIVTLPSDPNDGDVVTITNGGSNTVFIDGNGNTVNGSSDLYTLPVGETVELTYNDATGDWVVTGGNNAGSTAPVNDQPPITTDTDLDTVDPVRANTDVLVDTTGGDITITLPADPADGDTVRITNDGPNDVTILPGAGDTVDGGASYVLGPDETVLLQFDEVTDDWVVVGDTSEANNPVFPDFNYSLLDLPLDMAAWGDDSSTIGSSNTGGGNQPNIGDGLTPPDFVPSPGGPSNPANPGGGLPGNGVGVGDVPEGAIALRIQAVGMEDAVSGASVAVPLYAFGQASSVAFNTPYFLISYAPTFSSFSYVAGDADLHDEAQATTDLAHVLAGEFNLLAQARSSWRTFRTLSAELEEAAVGAIAERIGLQIPLAEAATAQALATAIYTLRIVEQAVAAGAVQTRYQALVELTDAVRAAGDVRDAYVRIVGDAATAEAVVDSLRGVFEQLNEAAEATAGVQTTLTIVVTEALRATAGDAFETLAQYLQNVGELAQVTLALRLPDEGYVGWVMNAEGSQPLSEYSNFPFNSFAQLAGAAYAASDTGLYRLGGDTDDGDPIDAVMRSLVLDFGTSLHKRMRSAYLGYTSSGEMLLRVRAVENGSMVEDWYQVVEIPANAPREQRVNLGLGVKSRYWQYELVNVDGADFEIDAIEFRPFVLTRRV